jgi:hypothetical protein
VTPLYSYLNRRPLPAGIKNLSRGAGVLLRVTAIAAAVCLSAVGLSTADNADAPSRKPTHIAAQGLGPALKELAQSRGLQVLYLSTTVRDLKTRGANGDITADEAFDQLLTGTGLTYRYLDENTVTVVPLNTAQSEGAGVALPSRRDPSGLGPSQPELATVSADQLLLLAQKLPAPAKTAAESADSAPLQEIIVTGSRIASPNEVSTSPIQVISSQSIQVSGKTDITDIISQLPQIFTNDLGQDLGNGTSGLTTAGGVATADLRGLGPGRTLVLVDGRRLGWVRPTRPLHSPHPISTKFRRASSIASKWSPAAPPRLRLGCHRRRRQLHHEEQLPGHSRWMATWARTDHDNNDAFIEGLVRQFGYTPPTGTDSRRAQRTFDVSDGHEFCGRQGQHHGLLELSSRRSGRRQSTRFRRLPVVPDFYANGSVTGVTCGGSSTRTGSSRRRAPTRETSTALTATVSCRTDRSRRRRRRFTTRSNISYLTREDDRYNAAFMAHDDINDYFKPYANSISWTTRRISRSRRRPVQGQQSNSIQLTGDYYINCSNPLLSAQEQGIICARPAADAAAAGQSRPPGSVLSPNCATCASAAATSRAATATIRLTSIPTTGRSFGTKGDFRDAWSYDVYGQYFYTFFRSNQQILELPGHHQRPAGDRHRGQPEVHRRPRGCVPYNIFSDGGVTQAALNYLYELGTAQGASTLRTLHADITGQLGGLWHHVAAGEGRVVHKYRLRASKRSRVSCSRMPPRRAACCPDSAARSRRSTTVSRCQRGISRGTRAARSRIRPAPRTCCSIPVSGIRITRRPSGHQYLQVRSAIRADCGLSNPRLLRQGDPRAERRRELFTRRSSGSAEVRQRPLRTAHHRPPHAAAVRTHGRDRRPVQRRHRFRRARRAVVARRAAIGS